MADRSRPAFERPIPWHALRAGVRHKRRRRLSAVAVAGTVAVVALAAGTVVGLGGPEEVERATFKVKVTGKPVAVLPDCPTPKASPLYVSARVPGLDKVFQLSPVPFLMNSCGRGTAVDMQLFPAGTRTMTCTVEDSGKNTNEGKWRFGVYEWTPPATPRPPAPPVEPPATISAGSLHLVTKGSATWPGTREVTLIVPNRGRSVALVIYCGDGLTERLTTDVRVNGRVIKGPQGCSAPPTRRGGGYLDLGRQPRGE
ncbi:hypothetical protein GCM10009733_079490 [Nonomuraea maheshkhaliensis]|uniref:DUF4333 domain-containing protein n=1 Tax=Nonomuraea maheshkhaliensis TaxID=419590 RepID=A0ABN2GF51_9ACTN